MNTNLEKLIIKEYSSGNSLNFIKDKYDLSLTNVYTVIRRRGINRPREVGSCNHNYFDNINTQEKAYWLGFLLADGCIYDNATKMKTGHRIILTLKISDEDHVCLFAKHLDCKNEIMKTDIYASIKFSSPHMIEVLSRYNLTPRKSFTAKAYEFDDEELQRHYWRGVIDGDGCLYISKSGCPSISLVGTHDVCESFLSWCKPFIRNKEKNVSKHERIYTIKFHGIDALEIMIRLYSNSSIYLDRKKQKLIDIIKLKLEQKKLVSENDCLFFLNEFKKKRFLISSNHVGINELSHGCFSSSP